MKRFVCITAAFIFAFATGLAASAVTMYARDGRTIDVAEDEVEAYTAVGWHADPFVTVYALDGRSLSVPGAQVEDYIKVGWYRELPTVTLYAEDGRTTDVSYPLVEAYTKVGWYTEPFVTLYTYDGERSIKVTQSRVAAHTAVGWYELSALPTVTLYALDGRTTEVNVTDVDAWIAVGWYAEPPVTMYSLDGRSVRVPYSQIDLYANSGWYMELPKQMLFALDGRHIEVPVTEVKSYLAVGWYTREALVKRGGSWKNPNTILNFMNALNIDYDRTLAERVTANCRNYNNTYVRNDIMKFNSQFGSYAVDINRALYYVNQLPVYYVDTSEYDGLADCITVQQVVERIYQMALKISRTPAPDSSDELIAYLEDLVVFEGGMAVAFGAIADALSEL